MTDLKIDYVPTDHLVPFANNARTHSDDQINQIAESIRVFGFNNPVLTDESGGVIAGHGRILAAEQMGMTELPVVKLPHLSEEEKRAYILADNKLALNAGWDEDLLSIELSELSSISDLDLQITGFGQDELDRLLSVDGTEGLTDPDSVPEAPENPTTVLGDVWILGNHRLMCGDSTSIDTVDKCLNGDDPVACITDPPYSVNYERSQSERGGNKDVHGSYKEADLDPTDLLNGFMALVNAPLLIFSYPIDRHFFALADALRENGFKFKKELVWVKDTFSFWMGARYQQRHEPILICSRDDRLHADNVPSTQSTVFEMKRPKKHELHPTTKPIDLWDLLFKYHTEPKDIIYEPFSGSGTSIIAAEQTGQRCYAIELSPNYVDVAIQRWQDFTGKQAVHEATGETFEAITNEARNKAAA